MHVVASLRVNRQFSAEGRVQCIATGCSHSDAVSDLNLLETLSVRTAGSKVLTVSFQNRIFPSWFL